MGNNNNSDISLTTNVRKIVVQEGIRTMTYDLTGRTMFYRVTTEGLGQPGCTILVKILIDENRSDGDKGHQVYTHGMTLIQSDYTKKRKSLTFEQGDRMITVFLK